jgi:predicted transcriptional regulator
LNYFNNKKESERRESIKITEKGKALPFEQKEEVIRNGRKVSRLKLT